MPPAIPSSTDLYVNTIDHTLVGFLRILRRYVRVVRIGPFELDLRGRVEKSYVETFDEIELAQNHLEDAAIALDRLQTDFADEKTRLGTLIGEISTKRDKHGRATSPLIRCVSRKRPECQIRSAVNSS